MELLSALFRWGHVLAAFLWVGMGYFFIFVYGPVAGAIDAETRKKLMPELFPRVLFWFRWGAVWTWVTGVVLLAVVFYHGGLLFEPDSGWSLAAGVMIAVTFLSSFAYDALFRSALGKNPKLFGAVAFALVALVLFLMARWAGFSYRAFNIHLAALFGTIMVWNVLFRLVPAQEKILAALKAGQAPDPALVAAAGARSRHNVYMSVPLLWGMLNQHTTYFSGDNLGIPTAWSFGVYLVVILIGWHAAFHLFRRSERVKGLRGEP
jgi:uncharacterized membrane protein